MNYKTLFDADLAILPILIAKWTNDPINATIVYQNNVLRNELGSWEKSKLVDLLDIISDGSGKIYLAKLIDKGRLVLSGRINDLEVKYHSRKSENHIQMAISDNTEINQIRDMEQRSTIINSFLNIGSHELKTPLNGILGITDLMLRDKTSIEHKKIFKLISESANTLNDIVSKMLKIIYVEDKTIPALEKPNSLNISEFFKNMYPVFEKHLVDRDFSKDHLHLNATSNIDMPEQHLYDIVTEIAINLRRNTPIGKRIEIFTTDENDSVHVIIENECKGIPTNCLEKIFQPFYRHQDPAKHSSGYEYGQGGIGMGLTIIKKYINQVNGKVWFENNSDYAPGKENLVRMHMIFPKKGANPNPD